jgi:tRNA (guanine37-N1)-methyltransferase
MKNEKITISIISVFPELYDSFIKTSIIARAIENGLLEFNFVRLSDMCEPKERIDEPTCGPGTGMILKPHVVEKAIQHCQKEWGDGYKIFFSPQGKLLDQKIFQKLSDTFVEKQSVSTKQDTNSHIILICARYEGVDARVEQKYADEIFSIGDYVLMGGDVAAQVFLEGFLRYVPGVVGKQESVEKDSFTGAFFDYPEYGLPVEWNKMKIPEIVQSGNHGAIEQWRKDEACKKTLENRFDWIRQSQLSNEEKVQCKKHIPNHYVALMHSDVLAKKDTVGHTSVTSLDLHDIARSCATYGIENVFMVTQLDDQRAIMKEFLNFWISGKGKTYNESRFKAVSRVVTTESLDDVITTIKEKEGVAPLIVSTSAKEYKNATHIDYFSQGTVWSHKRPVLFVFGTGHGLSENVLNKSDYLLEPLYGFTDYNHLSVRSAVAIILDRWVGLNPKIHAIELKKDDFHGG